MQMMPLIPIAGLQSSSFQLPFIQWQSNPSVSSTTSLDSLTAALQIDNSINGPLDSTQLFISSGASLPEILRSLMGGFFDTAKLSYSISQFGVFAGNNISVLGDANFNAITPTPIDRVLIAAQGSVTMNGVNSADSFFAQPLAKMDALLGGPVTSPDVNSSFNVLAGTAITLNNSLIYTLAPFAAFGNGDSAPPSMSLTNSSILMAGDNPGGSSMYFSPVSFTATDSNIVTVGNVAIGGNTPQGTPVTQNVTITNSPNSNTPTYYHAGYTVGSVTNSAPSTPGSSFNVSAVDTISILGTPNSSINMGASSINIDARTVNLKDVDFKAGSNVRLVSGDGTLAPNPNTGAASIARKVNFVSNVKYGGALMGTNLPPQVSISANGR